MAAKMDQLTARLESLQEEIYDLIERGSDRLEDQITYWELTRKEQAILYLARQKNISKIGLQPVPSLAMTEARAKEAIQMTLILTSLSKSPYAHESWNMQQTSRERLLVPPKFCFKKDGQQVDIWFDGNPANSVRETSWGFIYYQDSDDQWQKQPGEIDKEGLFYRDYSDIKDYYVSFKDLARRYSKEGRYQVKINDKIIADVVTSVDSAKPQSIPGPKATAARTGRRVSRRGRTKGKKRGNTSSSHSSTTSRSSRSSRSRSRSRSRSQARTPAAGVAPSPREVGTVRSTTPRGSGSRLRRLLQEARDPPAIVISGPANTVKCLRYRCKLRYQDFFSKISTTWWWTGEGRSKSGDASMLVLFHSDAQRNRFLEAVPVPPTVKIAAANLYLQ